MKRVVRLLWIACPLALATALSAPATGDVQVGVQIGIPAPPPVFINPPPFVVVPTTPAVRYAPDLAASVFLYGGRYYAWHEGSWFVTASAGQPWVFVEPVQVPRPVLIVPARYYNLPPGQRKKLYRSVPHHGYGHPGRGGHHKHHHKDDDD